MKNITKLLIGIGMLFLLLGIVYATDIDKLKVPQNCKELKDGVAPFTNHIDRTLYVEKASSDYKNEWFTNNSDYTVKDVGDNIYFYESDSLKSYGYQEIVNIDGTDYMVSIDQTSKLSPSEEKMLLGSMKEFNRLNNLQPVPI